MTKTGAYVDTETTGLGRKDELIELAVVIFRFDISARKPIKVLQSYSGLREPLCPIGEAAQEVHGITAREVRGKRLDDKRVISMLEKAEFVVSHNAAFDRRFMLKLYPMAGNLPWRCSMNDIAWAGKGFESKGLGYLLEAHQIKVGRAHRALEDVRGALRLLAIVDRSTGLPYMAELLGLSHMAVGQKRKMGWIVKVILALAAIVLASLLCGLLAELFG